MGSVSVGKNGTAVVTSRTPIPENSSLSVFSGSYHLLTVVNLPISIVTTLPKSSKTTALSKSTTKKILQTSADRWRIELEKSVEKTISEISIDQKAWRDVVDSAVAVLNNYAAAGGDITIHSVVALTNALNANPQVIEDISNATNAVRVATAQLPTPVDPVALREARESAITSLNAYLAAGGSNQDQPARTLLGAINASPPVIADITSASKAIQVATNQLPPLVDPKIAAEEEVMRRLVEGAEKLLDKYFAAGGSGEDEVALALLAALNADPRNPLSIIEAYNALSFATTQLPSAEILVDVLGG
jgi:hypothetical protein